MFEWKIKEIGDGLCEAAVHKDGVIFGKASKPMTMIEAVEWLALVANVPVQVREYIIEDKLKEAA